MNRIIVAAIVFLLAFNGWAAEHKPYTRNVAIVVYENAEPLDWTGPFEVYNDAGSFGAVNGENAFNVYVVSKTTDPLNSQGLKVVPNYSIANAPKPDIVVFPGGPSRNITDDPAFFAWAKNASTEAEIAQSVCTGAFVLGNAGLLDNLEVTTWYGAISGLQKQFPKTTVRDGRRFVDNGHVVTTAGISAGIDGSLHVVARLLGRRVADQVSRYMEYHWTPESYLSTNYVYLNPSTDDRGRLLQTADMRHEEKNFTEAADIYRAVLKQDDKNGSAWYYLAQDLRDLNDHLGAAEAYVKGSAIANEQQLPRAFYNAACEYALADRLDQSLEYLKKAYAAGFKDHNAIKNDPDLAKLRNDPRAQELIAAK
jgi:transcriptional regulator GlxA family with amidase domain